MEITQDQVDTAASQEQQEIDKGMAEARMQVLHNRIVTLRTRVNILEDVLEKHGIDPNAPEEKKPTKKSTKSK